MFLGVTLRTLQLEVLNRVAPALALVYNMVRGRPGLDKFAACADPVRQAINFFVKRDFLFPLEADNCLFRL